MAYDVHGAAFAHRIRQFLIVPAHRLDEFPAGYSWAGCAPALPASTSPAAPEYALKSSCRAIIFHRRSTAP